MTRRRLYTGSLLLLLATAPWPFVGQDTRIVLGLPPWAAYSLGMTALYALVMALLLRRYWQLSAGDLDGSSDQDAAEPPIPAGQPSGQPGGRTHSETGGPR